MRTFICGMLFPVAKLLWDTAPPAAHVVGFVILAAGMILSGCQDIKQITNDD